MPSNRLSQQIQFILEIDRLKQILRQTLLTDSSRQENSAEHSWHLAMMALILVEYAPIGTDLLRALKMLLIHDIVEIDAGDVSCYDVQGNLNKAEREQLAANRIFGLLPPDQSIDLQALWIEFERRETVTAQFATALDRLQPLLHNQQTQGHSWKVHAVKRNQVMQRMAPVEVGAPELWSHVQQVIEECIQAGYLTDIS